MAKPMSANERAKVASATRALETGRDDDATTQPSSASAIAIIPPVIETKGAPLTASSCALYRVWPHGTLQRNGRTLQPGDTIVLPEAEAAGIPCLLRADG